MRIPVFPGMGNSQFIRLSPLALIEGSRLRVSTLKFSVYSQIRTLDLEGQQLVSSRLQYTIIMRSLPILEREAPSIKVSYSTMYRRSVTAILFQTPIWTTTNSHLEAGLRLLITASLVELSIELSDMTSVTIMFSGMLPAICCY